MAVLGLVCEYNPFHRGHAWHLQHSRERLGGDALAVCVMTGDFVQRGEAAVFSKYARAEAACRCGADLVVELPLPWCLSSAEGFSRGAVTLLSALGADVLSFGAETEDLTPLRKLADCLCDESVQQEIRTRMASEETLSYAQIRQKLMAERLGEPTAQLLRQPNCILAVEYLKTIRQEGLDLEPMAILRRGCGHDSADGEDGCLSASAIREKLRRGEPITGAVPEHALQVYERELVLGCTPGAERAETALLARLRMLDSAAFEALPDAGEGMGRRLYKAVYAETSLASILDASSASRYTNARLRRAVLCACLGVDRHWSAGKPPYARILAMNERGQAHLASLREREGLPIVIKPASVRRLPEPCEALFRLGAEAHDLYTLCCADWRDHAPGEDWRRGPFRL